MTKLSSILFLLQQLQAPLANLNRKINSWMNIGLSRVKGRGEKLNKQVSETMALGIWKLIQWVLSLW